MFPPELSILRNVNPLPKPSDRDSPPRTGLPFSFLPSIEQSLPFPHLTPSLEDQLYRTGGFEEQKGAPSVGFSVQCEKNRMVVSIDKETLQVGNKTTD